jgi:hypothetical protein
MYFKRNVLHLSWIGILVMAVKVFISGPLFDRNVFFAAIVSIS